MYHTPILSTQWQNIYPETTPITENFNFFIFTYDTCVF